MASILETRRAQAFPQLTDTQLARLQAFGHRMATVPGQILTDPGDRSGRMYVVVAGSIEAVRPEHGVELPIAVQGVGGFTGEMSTLRATGSFARTRVREAGEVLVIEHDDLKRLVQNDAEISEIVMRAFIVRRMALIEASPEEVTLIGSRHSGDTLRLRQFLGRNSFPYRYWDAESDPDALAVLERFHVSATEVPVLVCRCGRLLRNPSEREAAEYLGMNPRLDAAQVRDLVVIGAGPAGLAAAVYAASEGLDVLVLECTAPGGQAGSSSKIENYLGFPTGISGQALAGRALVQAQKFGAEVAIAHNAVRLHCERLPYEIELAGGQRVLTRAIVIASGAKYRPLELGELERFLGIGIYYAATPVEARLCEAQDVVVVGGGNSAGQAVVYLSGRCRQVHMLVRGPALADTMSRYLIARIEDTPNVTLHTRTQITALAGEHELKQVTWRTASDQAQTHDVAHVFLMTGAEPQTRWLSGCLALDDKGFVRTGPDLHAQELARDLTWRKRSPHLLETSLPGVFAVGDVRAGSVKRVAAAVGEGSGCIQFVHRVLAE